MIAHMYYLTEYGKQEYICSTPVGNSNKEMRQWINETITRFESEGWFTKPEGDGQWSFHRGPNIRAVRIIIG